ncbi:MAG: lipocalin family protein [Bacteroidetes bacterium]|nr:lipocalin family protein [Bacteroidota bacterium]
MATLLTGSAYAQTQLKSINLDKYSGKWYEIASIPTGFDKNWNFVTESYTVNKKGKIDIYTTYKKGKSTKENAVRSKGFPDKESGNVKWKVQFFWPFKADYLVEELDDINYSYVVVGHPKKKYLYIMNRSGSMGNIQYQEVIERCAKKGYDISKIRKILQQ